MQNLKSVREALKATRAALRTATLSTLHLMRPFFSGIGSGAGDAWPLFGLAFAIIGCTVGGVVSVGLAAGCISLFLGISAAIFYYVYKDMREKEQSFEKELDKNQQKLVKDIKNYRKSIHQNFVNQKISGDFSTYFSQKLQQDLAEIEKEDIDSALYRILTILNEQKVFTFEGIFDAIHSIAVQTPVPIAQLIKEGFMSFVGTSGAIAGCSTGFLGLLTGVGLFTALIAFPGLGVGVLGGALFFAAVTAAYAIYNKREELQETAFNQLIKGMHQQLAQANFARDVDSSAYQVTRDLHHGSEGPRVEPQTVSQPIMQHYGKTKRLGLRFSSFFDEGDVSNNVRGEESALAFTAN